MAKTQIAHLINGNPGTIRNLDDSKYANVPLHDGSFVGTKNRDREKIATAILAENPGDITISVRNKEFHLSRNESASGKTIFWDSEISQDDYQFITGNPFVPQGKLQYAFFVALHPTGLFYVQYSKRKNDDSQWRFGHMTYVGEEFVKIL